MENSSGDKTVGYAKKTLQALIKALEMSNGIRQSSKRWRYEIDKENDTARIIDTQTMQEVEGYSKPVTELAKLGRHLRRTEIALADTTINLKEHYRNLGEAAHVRYTFDAITGEAYINKNGVRVTDLPDFLKNYIEMKHIEMGGKLMLEMPSTIKGWEKIGRHVESDYWALLNQAREALNQAVEFGSTEGEKEFTRRVDELQLALVARKMYRLKDPGQGNS